ncbi:hypothetical protein, partial [Gilliamella apicola]
VRVTLTGPFTTPSQWQSDNPGQIDRPSLPQVFELVGRDSHGNAVVKYGFVLKQWFIASSDSEGTQPIISSKCNSFGYRIPDVRDLTNASCQGWDSEYCGDHGNEIVVATPSSPNNKIWRHIGAGLFTEWGFIDSYPDSGFKNNYRTGDYATSDNRFFVKLFNGQIQYTSFLPGLNGACVYP